MTLSSPTPFRPRRFTGNEAQARSLIAQRALDCALTLGGVAWRLSLEPVSAPLPPSAVDWVLEGQWGGAPFVLQVPATTAQSWVAERFPGLDLATLPAALVDATIEEVMAAVIDALEALARGPAELHRVSTRGVKRVPPAHSFALTLAGDTQVIHAALTTDTLGLTLIAGLFSRLPEKPNVIGEEAFPLCLRAEIGRSTFTAAALASLVVHDLILIDHVWVSQSGELWLGDDGFGLLVRCEDTRLIVTHPFSPIGMRMPVTDPLLKPPVSPVAPVTAETIPITLVFDLGERCLTLGELRRLQTGQVLDLGKPLATAVNIRANGALIGYGELVEVDGRIGVCVAELAEARR